MINIKPVHFVAKSEDVAEIVLMPGDPLRAKYIAENFLENAKCINTIRNMFAYTGEYKGKKVTVASSGMGCPSMCIYAYELYHFYNVKKIIRIGTGGSLSKDVRIKDIVIADRAYSTSAIDIAINKKHEYFIEADQETNDILEKTIQSKGYSYKRGNILTGEVFDVYFDISHILDFFKDKDLLADEMEAFALFCIAKLENKKAACMMTIVDSKFETIIVDPKDRETSLNNMIITALDAIII